MQRVLATMVTTTSYGTWLPGDLRGYMDDGRILPSNPALLAHATAMLVKAPVVFTSHEQLTLFGSIQLAVEEFGYKLYCVSIESWHTHWLVWHNYDEVKDMVGRLKNRMRQSLHQGRVWTLGYYHRCLYTEDEMDARMRYIQAHAGHRRLPGELLWEPR